MPSMNYNASTSLIRLYWRFKCYAPFQVSSSNLSFFRKLAVLLSLRNAGCSFVSQGLCGWGSLEKTDCNLSIHDAAISLDGVGGRGALDRNLHIQHLLYVCYHNGINVVTPTSVIVLARCYERTGLNKSQDLLASRINFCLCL